MDEEIPRWLARTIVYGFWAIVLGIIALALALRFGLADPHPLGRNLRVDYFSDLSAWTLIAPPGAGITQVPGGLQITFTAPDQLALAVTDSPPLPLTMEVGGAQTDGPDGLIYGLVFGYRDAEHYTVIWMNNNGYAEAMTRAGESGVEWFPFQQWPHILYGREANRVRADVSIEGEPVEARINDELLVRFEPGREGRIGVAAKSQAAGTVVLNWLKVWSEE